MELRYFPDDDRKNLLDKIVGVLGLEVVPPQPLLEQGAVLHIEVLPGFGIVRVLLQLV